MRGLCRRIAKSAALGLAVWAFATPASAGNFYFSGGLGISKGEGDSGGVNDVVGTQVPIAGSSGDTSEVYGGALGYEFNLADALPGEKKLPEWMAARKISAPAWKARFEIEALGGRDYELTTASILPAAPFRADVSTWSVMHNLWIDIPVYRPISALFGRIPILEPLSLYTGVGIGAAGTELNTTDTVVAGSQDETQFAWNAGVGLGYALNHYTTFSMGYRYVDLGEIDAQLSDVNNPGNDGSFSLEQSAHEFRTEIRVNFYSFSIPRFRSNR